MNTQLSVNTVLEWVDSEECTKYERVLWLDPINGQMVVIVLFDKDLLPVWKNIDEYEEALTEGLIIKLKQDPYVNLKSLDNDIPGNHLSRRDKSWEIIKEIVCQEPDIYIPDSRGKLIRFVTDKYKVGKKRIYKLLYRYLAGGKIINALLPAYDKCGAPGHERNSNPNIKRGRPSNLSRYDPNIKGVNVDEETIRKFELGFNLFYNNTKGLTYKKAYDLTIGKFFRVGVSMVDGVAIPILPPDSELPTFRQFYYWVRKRLDLKKTTIAREGEKGYGLRWRPILGSSNQKAYGPGSVYQIDASNPPVYLVSSYDFFSVIGKPIVYLVVDVFSRMIVGLYIGLEGPNWIGAMMALANTFLNKVKFCAEYNVEIEENQWPCMGLPESIIADRGEMEGMNADYLSETLGIDVINDPPYRADLKGIIEQKFNQTEEKTLHQIPGVVKKKHRERGEKDYRPEAALTLDEFTTIIINTILDYNANHFIQDYSRNEFMISEFVEPVPIKLWEWGIQNRSGHFKEKSEDIIRMALMPKDNALITNKGIRFRGMHYSCKKALEEQWFQKARRYGSKSIKISYDPRRLNQIFILSDNGKEFETCELLSRENRYKNHHLEEVAKLLDFEKIQEDMHNQTRAQTTAVLHAKNEAIVKEAIKRKQKIMEDQNISERQVVKSIKPNRARDKELIRQEQAWTDKPENNIDNSSINNVVSINAFTNNLQGKNQTKRDMYLDMLEKQTTEE